MSTLLLDWREDTECKRVHAEIAELQRNIVKLRGQLQTATEKMERGKEPLEAVEGRHLIGKATAKELQTARDRHSAERREVEQLKYDLEESEKKLSALHRVLQESDSRPQKEAQKNLQKVYRAACGELHDALQAAITANRKVREIHSLALEQFPSAPNRIEGCPTAGGLPYLVFRALDGKTEAAFPGDTGTYLKELAEFLKR